MCKVVEEAAADVANSGDCFRIIVCAGWNARERDHIDELFALRHLCDAQDWKAFKVAAFQRANTKVEFAAYCQYLLKPPAAAAANDVAEDLSKMRLCLNSVAEVPASIGNLSQLAIDLRVIESWIGEQILIVCMPSTCSLVWYSCAFFHRQV